MKTSALAPLKGDSVDFLDYPHRRDFGKDFVLGWFRFVALSEPGTLPLVHNSLTPPRVDGLAIPKTGIRIEVRTDSSSITVEGNSGLRRKVEVIGLDASGNATVESIPPDMPSQSKILIGDRFRYIIVSSHNPETILGKVTLNDVDLEDKLEQSLEDLRNNPHYADALERPEVVEQIRSKFTELKEYYQGVRDPHEIESPPSDDDGGNGDGAGGGGVDWSIRWPPDWHCVIGNFNASIILNIVLAEAAAAAGVATIGELGVAAATDVLAVFGITPITAAAIFPWLALGLVFGLAVLCCNQADCGVV